MTTHTDRANDMQLDRPAPFCRAGFTLIELLLVVGIIAVLISLLLPAIQSSRENARRTQCAKSLMQIGLALGNYASVHKVFPPGVVNDKGPISNSPSGYHVGWAVQILPQLEQRGIFHQFNFSQSVYAPANETATVHHIEVYHCPSNPGMGPMSYAACHHDVEAAIAADNNGVFFLNSRVRRDDLVDGPSQTIFVGEIDQRSLNPGWAVGTMASLRNAGHPINAEDPFAPSLPPAGSIGPSGRQIVDPETLKQMIADGKISASLVGGFRSSHPGGSNFLFGDGAVRFLSERIPPHIYQSLANRHDGNLISDDEF
jgi:prepilin-type N-terminal cleavage/methylation domain-containing protein/prepilin-type processing-associated H-X9-DG protein